MLGDSDQSHRWEQIARELHELMSQNKIREFFQMANRVTQIKSQAQPLKGLIEEDGTTLFEEEAIQRRLAQHYNALSAQKCKPNQEVKMREDPPN